MHKRIEVIQSNPCPVGAGMDTLAAPNTEVAVMLNRLTGTVITHLHWTGHDAAMTTNALFADYLDDRTQVLIIHK
jgi:hypothetical protein